MPTDITIEIFARGGKDATLERRTRTIMPQLAAQVACTISEIGSEARLPLPAPVSGRLKIKDSDDGINLPDIWITIATSPTEKLRTTEPALLDALSKVATQLFHKEDPCLTIRVDVIYISTLSSTLKPVRSQEAPEEVVEDEAVTQ